MGNNKGINTQYISQTTHSQVKITKEQEQLKEEAQETNIPDKSQNEGEAANVFTHLFGELGDHHGLIIGPYHITDLPMIFIDNGFYLYPSVKSMEAAGLFTMHNGHPVRTSDHQAPALDISITNLVFFQWIALFILAIVFFRVGRKYKKEPTKAPQGFQNMIEVIITYIRDEIVKPNIPSHKISERLLPYFMGLFFFILIMNLFGLIPGGHTSTGAIGTTCGLAITAFLVINWTAIRESGIAAWFKHLLGGAPWWLFPIMIPIEILSMFIKPFALTIRLFANMSAGHIVILSLLGLLFYFKTIFISPAIVGFSVFIYLLELLVAFIQSYVFTMLTAIFVSLAIGHHSHEEH